MNFLILMKGSLSEEIINIFERGFEWNNHLCDLKVCHQELGASNCRHFPSIHVAPFIVFCLIHLFVQKDYQACQRTYLQTVTISPSYDHFLSGKV